MWDVRRTMTGAGAALAALALTAPSAMAGAHFQKASGALDAAGNLVVSYTEVGLGTGPVDYSLDAQRTATYGCFNQGGHHPAASNKETFGAPGEATATEQPRNGRVSSTITLGVLQPDASFSCPGNQELRIISASYCDAVLTDLTNAIAVTPSGGSGGCFSRTFT